MLACLYANEYVDTSRFIYIYTTLDARKSSYLFYSETIAFQRRVSARTCSLLRAVLSNIWECFNCAFNWIDLTSPGQQHRRTRRPWPQPADGRQDVGRCNPAHGAHQCWYVHSCPYDLTYEATSRFFRTGCEQEQEDTGRLECLDDRQFPRGYCRDFSRRNVRIGRPACSLLFFFLLFPFFPRRFHFRYCIRRERSGRINWYFMRPAKIIPDPRL